MFLKVRAFGEIGAHSNVCQSTLHLPTEAAPSSGQHEGKVLRKEWPLPFPGARWDGVWERRFIVLWQDKRTDVRWAQLNYHIWFNQLCEAFGLIREAENAHHHSQQLQRVRTIPSFLRTACSPASTLDPWSSGPPWAPHWGALPSRRGRRRQFGSLQRLAKKCSENEQLISAVKTDTRGA